MSEETTQRWAVTRPARPEVDLFWQGPDGRWGCWDAFGPRGDALTFPNEAAALEALVLTFGPEWRHHRSLDGARVVLLDGSFGGRTLLKQYTVRTFLGDMWNENFTDRRELEEIIAPPFETLMVRDGESEPWRVAGPHD